MSIREPDYSLLKNDDMRYFPRWGVSDNVSYHIDGEQKFYEGRTKDLSCAGACIIGEEHVAPHQRIKMTIELASGVRINLNARILRVRIENNQFHMGVTFYDTSDDVQDLILQYAFELDSEKLKKHWYKGW